MAVAAIILLLPLDSGFVNVYTRKIYCPTEKTGHKDPRLQKLSYVM